MKIVVSFGIYIAFVEKINLILRRTIISRYKPGLGLELGLGFGLWPMIGL
jgi:hypothetical protein